MPAPAQLIRGGWPVRCFAICPRRRSGRLDPIAVPVFSLMIPAVAVLSWATAVGKGLMAKFVSEYLGTLSKCMMIKADSDLVVAVGVAGELLAEDGESIVEIAKFVSEYSGTLSKCLVMKADSDLVVAVGVTGEMLAEDGQYIVECVVVKLSST